MKDLNQGRPVRHVVMSILLLLSFLTPGMLAKTDLTPPLSLGLSACITSVCTQSGCLGSVCEASGCTGSYCIGSACTNSLCAASFCVESFCLASACANSTCLTGCEENVSPPDCDNGRDLPGKCPQAR